ncbi:uncharacterized protein C8R40DRAFT_651344 [Lentinula edodes]|uniref:uncharacterized protein n=1 Tax=Lentinula edodes TaxID=5353 RepID=UPI001E8D3AB0|nr:uncharacterized protein C8R40DRAFT_651344 [Lentinula edodes]KAH7870315.1 hypothetical protein C8R40DRAFT_651344 [Lentinula edodes]
MTTRRRISQRKTPLENSEPEALERPRVHSTPKVPTLLAIMVLISVACYFALRELPYGSVQRQIAIQATEDDLEARDASIFSVQGIPGKGKGIIAVRNIKRGEVVLRERPLFVLPSEITTSPTALITRHLSLLTPYEHAQFYNLSYVNFPPDLDPENDFAELALAIFQTNAVSTGVNSVGIFPRMARLNHGCSSAFNVVYTWREKEGMLMVHAIRDIQKGEELLTTYTDTKRPRDQRRAYLLHQYSFHCSCDVCSLPDEKSKESHRRLMSMSELYAQFASWGTGTIDGVQAAEIAKRIWELGSEEGYLSERGRLAADVAWVAAAHSDAASTNAWAKLAEEWFGYEVGVDSEQVLEMRTLQTQPEAHLAWASRQATRVPTPHL